MTEKSAAARSLCRFSFARSLLCVSALVTVATLSGCGGGSSDTPETPVLPRAWSPVSVSAVSSLSVPKVFSDGVGGVLVVTSSPTNTVVQRFDGVTGSWQPAQIFAPAIYAFRSASGVTLVGHDTANWWRVDVSATTTSPTTPVLPYTDAAPNYSVVGSAAHGRLLFVDGALTESGSVLRVREVDGASVVATTTFDDASVGVRDAFVRDPDGDWMSSWWVGRRENVTGLAMRGLNETTFRTRLSGATEWIGGAGTALAQLSIEGDGRASSVTRQTFSDGSPPVGRWYRLVSGSLLDIWTLGDVKSGRPDQTSHIVRADGTPVWAAYDSTVGSNRIWEGRDIATWTTTDASEAACLPSRMACQAFSAPSATRVASLSQNVGQSATSNDLFISERAQVGRWASSARVSLATLASAGGDANSTSHQLAAYVESGPAQIVVGFVRYQLSPSDTRYTTFATGK